MDSYGAYEPKSRFGEGRGEEEEEEEDEIEEFENKNSLNKHLVLIRQWRIREQSHWKTIAFSMKMKKSRAESLKHNLF